MNSENEALRNNNDISLGNTKNIQKMSSRFTKKTLDILSEDSGEKNVSNVFESENPENVDTDTPSGSKETSANDVFIKKNEEIEEISIDIEDIKREISDDVKETLSDAIPKMLSEKLPDIFRDSLKGDSIAAELNGVRTELETIKKRMQTMQISMEDGLRDNGNNTTSLHKSAAEIRDRIAEISKTMNSISKLSDSVFDLKNAQSNMRKTLDSQGTLILRLKKKLNVSTVILSVLGVLIIILQIIGLLS